MDTECGGKKWDERGQDMKELLVLQRERARAWDKEKGPPGMPGSTCCSEQHQLDQGAQGFIQVRCKYPHKGRPQTSVRSGPGAEHPHGESHVLISSSLISLGLVLPLCTLSVPCSSPLLPPQHFCCPHLTSLAARRLWGDHAKGHTRGYGKVASIPCCLQTTSLGPGRWGVAGKQAGT